MKQFGCFSMLLGKPDGQLLVYPNPVEKPLPLYIFPLVGSTQNLKSYFLNVKADKPR